MIQDEAKQVSERVRRAVLQAMDMEPTIARAFDEKIAEACALAVVEVLREVGHVEEKTRKPRGRKWHITGEGRAWGPEEALKRWELTPEKLEMHEGRLLWSDAERVNLLALLLENVGADKAVSLGDPKVWRRALAKLAEMDHAAAASMPT